MKNQTLKSLNVRYSRLKNLSEVRLNSLIKLHKSNVLTESKEVRQLEREIFVESVRNERLTILVEATQLDYETSGKIFLNVSNIVKNLADDIGCAKISTWANETQRELDDLFISGEPKSGLAKKFMSKFADLMIMAKGLYAISQDLGGPSDSPPNEDLYKPGVGEIADLLNSAIRASKTSSIDEAPDYRQRIRAAIEKQDRMNYPLSTDVGLKSSYMKKAPGAPLRDLLVGLGKKMPTRGVASRQAQVGNINAVTEKLVSLMKNTAMKTSPGFEGILRKAGSSVSDIVGCVMKLNVDTIRQSFQVFGKALESIPSLDQVLLDPGAYKVSLLKRIGSLFTDIGSGKSGR